LVTICVGQHRIGRDVVLDNEVGWEVELRMAPSVVSIARQWIALHGSEPSLIEESTNRLRCHRRTIEPAVVQSFRGYYKVKLGDQAGRHCVMNDAMARGDTARIGIGAHLDMVRDEVEIDRVVFRAL
jgi:hypothetical protein